MVLLKRGVIEQLGGHLVSARVNPPHIVFFGCPQASHTYTADWTFGLVFWGCIVSCHKLDNLCCSRCLMLLKNALKECGLNDIFIISCLTNLVAAAFLVFLGSHTK